MYAEIWTIARNGVLAFIADNAVSRGAAITFYAVTGFVPALIFVVAGLSALFGADVIRTIVAHALHVFMGREADALMQLATGSARASSPNLREKIIAGLVLIVTASGAFGEIQSALNAIWNTHASGGTLRRILRDRATSLLLVVGLGALLLLSVLATAAIALWSTRFHFALGTASALLPLASFAFSLLLAAVLFAAIYKVLPDIDLQWSDVAVGAVVTALLYELGQVIIGAYFEHQSGVGANGAAGSMIVLLLWIYYSVQVFLLGAEFTKAYAVRHGSAGARSAVQAAGEPGTMRPAESEGRGGRAEEGICRAESARALLSRNARRPPLG